MLSLGSSWQALKIASVQIQGTDTEAMNDLRAAAEGALQGKYFGIIPRSNSIFYPKGEVAKRIMTASPRIGEVKIKRAGLKSISVDVTERKPAAMVCATLPDFGIIIDQSKDNHDSCYLADERGFIFSTASPSSSGLRPRFYIPELALIGSTTIVGHFATSSQEWSRIRRFYEEVEANGIRTQAILFKDRGEYELYVEPPVTRSDNETSVYLDTIVIYFNSARSLSDQLSNLVSFWITMKEKGGGRDETAQIDYIDVRYGSNIFYRKQKK